MSHVTNVLKNETVLEILRSTYKTIYISAVDAGKEIGIAPGTTRNMLTQERFPLKTLKIGVKRVVSIVELADFVNKRSQTPLQVKRGPRTKKERIEQRRV